MSMIKRLAIVNIFLITLMMMSCDSLIEPDKILMDAQIELHLPEGVEVEQVNFVLDLHNVNTNEDIHKGSIDDLTIQLPLMRGLYIVHVDGVALIKKGDNQERLRLRGYLENHLILEPSEPVIVPLYPMNNL